MQSQWRDIGVEVTIHNEPPRTLFGETLKHRAFTGLAMFGWSGAVESSPRQILSSGQVPTAANNWGGTNYTDFRNARLDADIDALERELDFAKRRPLCISAIVPAPRPIILRQVHSFKVARIRKA